MRRPCRASLHLYQMQCDDSRDARVGRLYIKYINKCKPIKNVIRVNPINEIRYNNCRDALHGRLKLYSWASQIIFMGVSNYIHGRLILYQWASQIIFMGVSNYIHGRLILYSWAAHIISMGGSFYIQGVPYYIFRHLIIQMPGYRFIYELYTETPM